MLFRYFRNQSDNAERRRERRSIEKTAAESKQGANRMYRTGLIPAQSVAVMPTEVKKLLYLTSALIY